ncbi:MAG: hypothetical protein M3P12_13610 [Gemmatimonadota bacterium]|nr:hypothetical protein [Gemmatimonadota bacterium]
MIPLEDSLAKLRSERAEFRLESRHAIPDLVLLNYINEVEENAFAVIEFKNTQSIHRAWPNARAAFESAQLALLLTTDPQYDLAGARAWIYHLRKDRTFAEADEESFNSESGGFSSDAWYQGAVKEMEALWDELSPGKGRFIPQAELLLDQQPRRPDNWAGVSIAPTLRDRMKTITVGSSPSSNLDTAEVYNRAYSGLTRHSHPQMRLRPMGVRGTPNGPVTFEFEERNVAQEYESISALTAGATLLAIAALLVRSRHAI